MWTLPHLLLLVVFLPVAMGTTYVTPPQDRSPLMSVPLSMATPSDPMDPQYCQAMLESGVPAEQLPWFCVCSHCNGQEGPKGDRGDQGLPGHPGSSGRRGMTGSRGPPGFVGRPGMKGQKGDNGEKGTRGLEGPTGSKGALGFKGEKGDQGLEGRPGGPGLKGEDGTCPDTCESVMGPPGPPGVPGRAGGRGLNGAKGQQGSKGMRGDMGEAGRHGAGGATGEKGEPGPQGDCNCTDGTDGAPGPKGNKGDMGGQGDTGPQGQTGPKGDKGDMGMMGMRGPPGACMSESRSAFSAALTSSYPEPDQPVAFSHVFHNMRMHYNPEFGLYSAPVNGTYFFSYHLTVYSKVLIVGLFHNHKLVTVTTDPAVLGTTSHSVILHLTQGDRVWIQVKDQNTNGMFAGGEAGSTFSGFLLYPDSCEQPSLRAPLGPLPTMEEDYSWPETSTGQPLVTSTLQPSD